MTEKKAQAKKVDSWKPVGRIERLMVEGGYQDYVKVLLKRGDTAALKALELQLKGGPCHYCNVPFKEVRVHGQYGEFVMYEPSCRCYKRCDRVIYEASVDVDHNPTPEIRCGEWMVEERFKNFTRCILCYGEPRKEEPKKQGASGGRGRRYKDVKAAAAGEREEE